MEVETSEIWIIQSAQKPDAEWDSIGALIDSALDFTRHSKDGGPTFAVLSLIQGFARKLPEIRRRRKRIQELLLVLHIPSDCRAGDKAPEHTTICYFDDQRRIVRWEPTNWDIIAELTGYDVAEYYK